MLEFLIERGREAVRAGEWEEALERFEAAFSHAARTGPASALAEVARQIGVARQRRGDFELAGEAFELCMAIADAHGLDTERAAGLICLATREHHLGRLGEAEGYYTQAQSIVDRIRDESLAATIEHNLGVLANIRGELELAVRRYRSALRRHRRLGDEPKELAALCNLGMASVDLGRWRPAARYFDLAEAIARRLEDSLALGNIEVNRAELHLRSGRFTRARGSCDRAFEIYGRLAFREGVAEVHKFYGVLYRESGKLQLADTHLSASVTLARECRDRLLEAEALSEWALVHLDEGRNREALQCLNESHRLFAELHATRELLDLAGRLDDLEIRYLQVVRAWGESIESKDRYTAGHCERVANFACMLAEAVGFGGRDLTWLRMGGYLHDVGKIVVPAEVLNKPGKLTAEEWGLMKRHTSEGDRIVAELDFPWDVGAVVRSHHERWDGSGYPDGLRGEEIPLTARILCLADVYDALTTTRSYRPAMSQAQALKVMEADVGRIFDPDLFGPFRDLIASQAPVLDERFPVFSGTVAAA